MEVRNRNACTIDCLPKDVWRQIFSHLDRNGRKSTLLVCKLFCSIYCTFVRELNLNCTSFTYSDLESLLERYSGLKKLCVGFGNPTTVLLAISISELNIEKLHLIADELREQQTIEIMSTSKVIKSIKSLEGNMVDTIATQQVVEFVKLFPLLTEFGVTRCHKWDDHVFQKVTSHLPNLRKLNLEFCDASDETLAILSTNCPKLSSVNFQGCSNFTPEALCKFFCNNPQLRSVYMPDFENSPSVSAVSKMAECMKVLKNLSQLYFRSDIIQDAILFALAESRPPLKLLEIGHYFSQFTMARLTRLLSACSGLENLGIDLRSFETGNTHDAEFSIVVKRLSNLKHIRIWSCVGCPVTLFSLVENCPLLETIGLFCDSYPTEVHNDYVMTRPTKKNYSIKSIIFYPLMFDISLRPILEQYCPNLEGLTVYRG